VFRAKRAIAFTGRYSFPRRSFLSETVIVVSESSESKWGEHCLSQNIQNMPPTNSVTVAYRNRL